MARQILLEAGDRNDGHATSKVLAQNAHSERVGDAKRPLIERIERGRGNYNCVRFGEGIAFTWHAILESDGSGSFSAMCWTW